MIDINSLTWRHIKAFAAEQRVSAVEDLIADIDADKQRGAISMLDKLMQLPEESEPQTVVQDDYT